MTPSLVATTFVTTTQIVLKGGIGRSLIRDSEGEDDMLANRARR
jgi:hypothetical protein